MVGAPRQKRHRAQAAARLWLNKAAWRAEPGSWPASLPGRLVPTQRGVASGRHVFVCRFKSGGWRGISVAGAVRALRGCEGRRLLPRHPRWRARAGIRWATLADSSHGAGQRSSSAFLASAALRDAFSFAAQPLVSRPWLQAAEGESAGPASTTLRNAPPPPRGRPQGATVRHRSAGCWLRLHAALNWLPHTTRGVAVRHCAACLNGNSNATCASARTPSFQPQRDRPPAERWGRRHAPRGAACRGARGGLG